jgi:hypothetical protein
VKLATRLLVLLGIAGIAMCFFRSAPRDVVLVYDLGDIHDATQLEVRILKGSETVRLAEFPSPPAQVRHQVRLTDGTYHVRVGIDRPGAVQHADREITVTESQTIILPLAP